MKFISSTIKNPTSDQQLSLPNLIHGVRIEKNKKIEWVKKKQFLIAKEKKMLAKNTPRCDVYTAMRNKDRKKKLRTPIKKASSVVVHTATYNP